MITLYRLFESGKTSNPRKLSFIQRLIHPKTRKKVHSLISKNVSDSHKYDMAAQAREIIGHLR